MKALKKITTSQLFQASSLNAVSVLVRAAGGVLALKVTAIFIGPTGMALTGNLRIFLTSLETVSTLGLQNGIIKYTAENEKQEQQLYRILSTAFLSVLAVIVVFSILLFTFSEYLNIWVFREEAGYAWAFKLLAFMLPWYIGNIMFTHVLNGLGRFKQVMHISIWGNIIGVLVSAVLIWKMQLNGAFIALILYPASLFIFTFLLVKRQLKVPLFFKKEYFDLAVLKNLLAYSLMSLVTVVLGQFVFISIRNMIIDTVSKEAAGYYEGLNRFSVFYLLFASTLLTVYFLPKLSIAQTNKETKAVFLSYYKIMLPLFVGGLTLVYCLKGFIVNVLLSKEYLPMTNLFFYQFLGDFFKVASMILGYQLIAKKQTTVFIISEILSFTILYVSSHIFITQYGVEGVVMAHALTYFVYSVVLAVYFRKIIC